MAKKRFILDENFIKKNNRENLVKWLIWGGVALLLIIIIIIVIVNTKSHNRKVEKTPVVEVKKELIVEAGSSLPDIGDYFSKLENVSVKDIKITYPDNIETSYDISGCSEEEQEQIKDNLEYPSCSVRVLNNPDNYTIKLEVLNKEYSVNLVVQDTKAPSLLVKDLEIYVNDTYKASDFVKDCYDVSGICNVVFEEDNNYQEEGSYEIKLKASDKYDNTALYDANLKIVKPDKEIYTVTFNANGGSSVASVKVAEGDKVQEPDKPTRSGYTFVGWYRGTNKYDFNSAITSNVTLTAHWEKNTSSGVIPVTGVALNYQAITVKIGESQTVSATVYPANATNKAVSWSSANTDIASVSNGIITGLKVGTTVVTASIQGKTAQVRVSVISGNTCKFGDNSYNSNIYTLSVNLSTNGCALNPNSNPSENLSINDYKSAIQELEAMGIKTSSGNTSNVKHTINHIRVMNKTNTGLVGYQVEITLEVLDPDNPYVVMKANYILRSDGTRIMRSNNIRKNNITFQ